MTIRVGIKSECFKHIKGSNDNLYSNDSISLKCVKNSFAAFQLFLENNTPFTLSLSSTPAFTIYPQRSIMRVSAEFDGIGDIAINNISYTEDDNGFKRTDCIEIKDYIHIDADSPTPLWCEIIIGHAVSPGIYAGTVKIFERKLFEPEINVITLNISLEIFDIILPPPDEYVMHLDLWQHISNIARKHDVRLFSEEHFEIVEKYVKSLARLGQKAITVIASEIPWSGQRTFKDLSEPTDLFEYSFIKTSKTKDGVFIFDYSVMDRYIEICISSGISKTIEVFGLCGIWMSEDIGFGKTALDFPDGVRIRYYDESTGIYAFMDQASHIRLYIKSLYNHFIEKEWLDKVRIIADEPDDIVTYRSTINTILEEGPEFKFAVSINNAKFTTEFDDVMSDVIPSLKCLAADLEFIKELKDKTVCWYVCCRPHYPNTFIKSDLLESRFICILTSLLNLDGFLRWNYTVWPENPRKHNIFRSPEWLAGDMNFVYPGNNGAPLLTLRYKALLRGIEDFELMEKAKTVNPSIIKSIRHLLMGDTTIQQLSDMGYDESEPLKPFSLNEKDYDEVREILYRTI